MPTLVTTTGQLIAPGGDGRRYQLTAGGRPSLNVSSVPFAGGGSRSAGVELIGGSAGGGSISYAQLYRSQPWVHIVVNKLARAIARIPLKVYERDSQGAKRRIREGRLHELLEAPAPRRAPIDFKQWLALPTLLHGNGIVAYYRPERGGPPTKVWPLDWRYLEPIVEYEGGPIAAWATTEFGDRAYVAAEDCIHAAWWPPDGKIGISPLQALGVTVQLEDASQRYQANSFRNAARPSGAVVLPRDTHLDQEERRELRSDIRAMHEGIDNAFRVALLSGGAEWKPMSFSAHEAELIEQRKLNREEAAAVFDIPPPLIGILDRATYANIGTQHRMFYTDVLGPWLSLFEQTIQVQLIDPEPAFAGQFVEFDLNEMLRGDPVQRAASLKTSIESGVLTINEARDLENRPRYEHPDADRPLIPVNNLAPVGTDRSGEEPPEDEEPPVEVPST